MITPSVVDVGPVGGGATSGKEAVQVVVDARPVERGDVHLLGRAVNESTRHLDLEHSPSCSPASPRPPSQGRSGRCSGLDFSHPRCEDMLPAGLCVHERPATEALRCRTGWVELRGRGARQLESVARRPSASRARRGAHLHAARCSGSVRFDGGGETGRRSTVSAARR